MDLINLPDEIKLIIIGYLPITKLVSDNPLPIFDEYIINYINNRVLTNMYYTGFLYRRSIYSDMVYDKIKEIADMIGEQFIKETNMIGGPINILNQELNQELNTIISLVIIFKFSTVGKRYNGSRDDINYCLTNSSLANNSCSWCYDGTMSCFEYTDKNIKTEIFRILIKNIDYSDTIVDIKCMELIKTNGNNKYKLNVIKKFI